MSEQGSNAEARKSSVSKPVLLGGILGNLLPMLVSTDFGGKSSDQTSSASCA